MEVSVIVTTYNHEKYIAQALDSVLMQKTNFQYEIIIGEDCSIDRTRSIVLDFQLRNPGKIRLLLPAENLGKGGNKIFPRALELAQGQYVAVLDGDDYWTTPEKLQQQVDFLDQHPECALCFHNVTEMREDGVRGNWDYTPPGKKEVTELEDLLPRNFIATSSVMFRRKLHDYLPAWVYEVALEDWAFHVLNAQHGKIGYVDKVMGVYRIHREGLWSKRSFRQMLEGEIQFYDYVKAHLSPQYEKNIEAELAKRHALLAQEQAMEEIEARIKRLRRDTNHQLLVTRIREMVQISLPRSANVILLGDGENELLQLGSRRTWRLPHPDESERERLFAEGVHGTKEAPWIGRGSIYEFCLYAGKEHRQRLATVKMIFGTALYDLTPTDFDLQNGQAVLAAQLSSVPPGIHFAKAAISWNTGDGSWGQVYVTIRDINIPYPADSAAAIAQLEKLIYQGGEYLLAPPNAFPLLEQYPELKEHLERHYRLLPSEENICRIYDLREILQKTGGHEGKMGNQIEIS